MNQVTNAQSDKQRIPVRYEYTPAFPQILSHLSASLLVSTYQAGKVLVLGVHEGKLAISWLEMDQPMGLAVSASRVAIGTRRQIHFLAPAHETLTTDGGHDGCFVPRSSLFSGAIHGHDLAWGDGGLWVVNTLFSCLSTLHPQYSFVPQWRPPFISQLIDQDRCHLNGMAMIDGRPGYVTVLGETDTPAGWRADKLSGGAILEVPSGRVVCRGLAMPHSPRWSQGRLLVLNSGHGELCSVDPSGGQVTSIDRMPGYTRGLAVSGQFAFVGLSKIRETAIFGGLPIGENPNDLRCGIGVVDLLSGRTVATFQFHDGVEEIFAVELLPGIHHPLLAGAFFDDQQREVWIVPADSIARPSLVAELPIFADERSLAEDNALAGGSRSVEQLLAFANAMRDAGRMDESAQHLERAAALAANPCAILVELGNLRQDQGNQNAARLCYERALQADPTSTAAQQNLGYLTFNLGMADESAEILDRLAAHDPSPLNRLLAASVMPVVYDSQSDIDFWQHRSLSHLRAAVNGTASLDATQTLVPTLFFAPYSGTCVAELMRLRGQIVTGRDYTNNRQPWSAVQSGPKRIGFISAYFRDHTIGRLNIGRFEQAKQNGVEKILIYAGQMEDSMVERFRSSADQFVRLPRDLTAAIGCLEALKLDVLVYADIGMDALTTTLAFSRFAAVQACTWGHPVTSGSPMIDYFLSSQEIETAEAQKHYTETLILTESLGLCYQRPDVDWSSGQADRANLREQLSLPLGKHLYGCPQTLFKFHPVMDSILRGILEADDLAEIVLIQGRVPRWTSDLRRRMRRTIPSLADRIRFVSPMPNPQYLKLLAACDVLLDTFPFGGGNSTLEALSVETPVITLPSDYLSGRLTAAFLRRVGLEQCIAETEQSFINIAVEIANNPDKRQAFVRHINQNAQHLFQDTQAAGQWLAVIASLSR